MKPLILTAKRKEILEKLEIYDVQDLMHYYPFRYDFNQLQTFSEFKINDKVVFQATILTNTSTYRYGYKKSVTRFQVVLEQTVIQCILYNRNWVQLDLSKEIVIVGKYIGNQKVQVISYSQGIENNSILGIIPNYSLKQDINQRDLRAILLKNKDIILSQVIDIVPPEFRNKYHLLSKKEAIEQIHFPINRELLQKAVGYLKYEEFLKFYIVLKSIKNQSVSTKKRKNFDLSEIEKLIHSLHFTLTIDQHKVIKQILDDIQRPQNMYRLVQGDVGSGKTIVAFVALYANFLAGYQGVFMAPTEILATQHFHECQRLLGSCMKISLLHSSLSTLEKQEIASSIQNGTIDVLIGTHAVFQDGIVYHNLGLAISDEQHRFGVKQRRKLKNKGDDVDFLLMSATPIPRTLASAIYGDMDVSTIETIPSDRKGCASFYVAENSIRSILPDIEKTLSQHQQIYIVCAAISKGELGVKDAETLYASIVKLFKNHRVALLHGKMDSDEKTRIMEAFLANQIQILVSTTVIEVGVNNPNATMMIVYDADRFGLSQLHQLRGRVQRGHHRGSFYMLSDKKDTDLIHRLKTLVDSNDGFYIAEQDLKLRGPGDILGFRQSGLPSFILGNFIEDKIIVEQAKKDADEIVKQQQYEQIVDNITSKYLKNMVD